MADSVIIRKAEAADAPAVGKIYALSWQAGYAGILPEAFLAGLTPENCAPAPEKLAAGNTLVAQAGELAGLASFGPPRTEPRELGELYTIYTLPSHWRQGVGRQLLEAARRQMKAQGCPGMFLWVLRDNARARRFYESMGLTFTGRERELSVAGTAAAEVQYAQRW